MKNTNPIKEQVSEIYSRIKLYVVIENLKTELVSEAAKSDPNYHKQLQEALAYAEKRKTYLV